ncbi:MAG: YceI family protein [Planctomycetes bacterium]|nr:YceI family protein [Planctomycetota bacterium]
MLLKSFLTFSLVGAGVCAVPGYFISSMSPVADASAAITPADATFKVDSVHSSGAFRVKHMGISYFYGRFNKITGSLVFDEAAPEKGSVSIEIAADSVDTNNKGRDEHIKSTDFFNVKQFPVITFKSTAIKKTSDKHFDISGDLTLHGVTKNITIKAEHVGSAKDPRGGAAAGFDILMQFKRSDFDMKNKLDMIGDEIDFHAGIEAGSGGKKE